MVPVFGFGQNDVFNIKQPKIDFLLTYKPGRSKWEKWFKIFLKCASLVMCGRFGVMPYPHPIAVVGKFQIILKLELQCWIQGKGPGGLAPPYFSTKMRPKGPKKFFWRPPLPYLRVWMTASPPLCEGLDLPLNLPHVYGTQLERLETLKRSRFGHCIDFLKVLRFSPVCLYWFGT